MTRGAKADVLRWGRWIGGNWVKGIAPGGDQNSNSIDVCCATPQAMDCHVAALLAMTPQRLWEERCLCERSEAIHLSNHAVPINRLPRLTVSQRRKAQPYNYNYNYKKTLSITPKQITGINLILHIKQIFTQTVRHNHCTQLFKLT